ncbi:hypothetical protein NLJ89_g4155 [Agrocybe chaxingu]|uniref:Uncharacterized protein n=1 Tax=Agrocybe chaxingu TaxID=84603 RepID=A0A9W8K4H8_9AGAR|nr:hypothetical protein NLJ89_g4155 [Agrocybe chaxingu]
MLTAVMYETKWHKQRALPPATIRHSGHTGMTSKLETFLDSLASISVSLERKEVVALGIREVASSQMSTGGPAEERTLLIAENDNLDLTSPAVVHLKKVWSKLDELVSIIQKISAEGGKVLMGVAAVEALMENEKGLNGFQELRAMIYEHTFPKHSDRLDRRLEDFDLFVSALREITDMMQSGTSNPGQRQRPAALNLPTEEDFKRLNQIRGYLDEFKTHRKFNSSVHVAVIDKIQVIIDSWDMTPLGTWNSLITRNRLKKLPKVSGVDKVQVRVRICH